jgi:hypothetical protein
LQQSFPFWCDGKVFLPAPDQGGLEPFFQCPDLLADGALSYRVQFGRFREARGFYQVAENFEGFDLHPGRPAI